MYNATRKLVSFNKIIMYVVCEINRINKYWGAI